MRHVLIVTIINIVVLIVTFYLTFTSATRDAIAVDVDLIRYQNPEGRLSNGNCCSGYKSSLDGMGGICRGGNSSCSPYFKVCVTHLPPPTKTSMSTSSSLSFP